MKRFLPLGLVLILTGCIESLSPLNQPESRRFDFIKAELFGCNDSIGSVNVGYVRGCAILGDNGRRIPGSNEYGPISADSIVTGKWFVRWGYFAYVSRIQASTCYFHPEVNEWLCTWNWVTFTRNGPIPSLEPETEGVVVQERGDWAAYFMLHWRGKHRIILRGEASAYDPIADTLDIEITDPSAPLPSVLEVERIFNSSSTLIVR